MSPGSEKSSGGEKARISAGNGGTRRGLRGAKGGVTIGAVEVVLRAGVNKTETLQDLDLPFYATLGANYRF